MRMFGKFLVFTNLVMSLVFLTWAIGLYTQKMEWAPRKDIFRNQINLETGRVYEIHQQIKHLGEDRDLAELRWSTDTAQLTKADTQRQQNKDFYADQLALAEYGQTKKGKPAELVIRQAVRDAEGMPVLDDKQRPPVKHGDQTVKSLADYNAEYDDLKKKLDDIQVQIQKSIDDSDRLTGEIAGIKGKSEGLRKRLVDQLSYKRLFDDEMAKLGPELNSQRINIEQHKKRLAELEKRFKEIAPGPGAGAGIGLK